MTQSVANIHLSSQHIQNQAQSYPITVNTNQFKIPLGSPSSGFKVFHFHGMETQKQPVSPQQQPLVTSTSSLAVDTPGKLKLAVPTSDSMSSTGILGTVTEVKLAFKTVPVPAEDSLSAIPTTATFPTVSSCHSLPVTLPTPVDQCLSVMTAIPGTTTFVEGHHIAVTKNPPLDFSVKKEDFQSTSTQTPTSNKRQPPASFIAGDRTSDLISRSFPSPNKMLRLSFNMQNEIFHKPGTSTGSGGLLQCSESESHLSVVVEDLSNKPSTSTDVVTTTSAAQTSNKDMWRPW
jgi:hypothetical protein